MNYEVGRSERAFCYRCRNLSTRSIVIARTRPTLAEIASAAGVSVATVSKVLNEREDVSAETRRRVQKHLREASYRPVNRAPRHTGLIEVAVPAWQNAYMVSVIDGINTAAQADGYELVIGPQLHGDDVDLDLQRLRATNRAGAILITVDASQPSIKNVVEAGFPLVVVDPVRVGDTNCVTIGATNYAGGVTATEHLLGLGHRRIAHAGGLISGDIGKARLAGYLSALRASGAPIDDSMITHCEFNYDAGRAIAPLLLDRADRPTAVFAAGDEIAQGLMEEARRRSIRVPQELSVIGFDDSFMASRTTPPLTTIAQPLVEMGQVATRSLTQLINNSMVGTRHIELATRLVIRDSTAPLSET
ncbi:LacI family transcriptional regulator [Microlunatus phosphovorus NM-1]|uniref:LacI family transcriptional regulator n=1 Tax=Microlunatus phosphovorus (strain ATCC 700054 / DSM 10555 / JCM 9379 / NBRC 101784 / NCIMB 13414 / VKM Ac-1990 / NM-1) TaxID=1032480 RepID=F5XL27_MICPN|nr:LacI family DNA-binding transcriptional regulator [Microlunatus phosphovorus]BAK33715.1 LacI family transcriptional regulator [Microlunatus phosphovorus NM-1]